MRRLVTFAISCSTAAALLLATSSVLAQDLAPPPPIAPPPPMDPNAPGAPGTDPNAPGQGEQATNQKLNQAEQEDSGRSFELFWADAHLGASYIDMRQFSSDTLAIEQASSAGPMVSFGAGLRFVVLVVGVRAKYNALSAFNMWQINGEIGLKIPISKLDFLVGLHGGYSFVGSLGEANSATNSATPTSTDDVKIRGFNAGLDLALDYYITPIFSIGGGFFVDGLFLNRPKLEVPGNLTPQQQALLDQQELYQKSGTSAGLQLGGGLRLGLHLGL
jgi:hypothetical protein